MMLAEASGILSHSFQATKENFMNLSSPITIQPPSFTRANGEVRVLKPITLTKLDLIIIDNVERKSVVAHIRPCPRPLVLWTKDTYDAAGDYTQAQIEARIMELLGSDPKKILEELFLSPTK